MERKIWAKVTDTPLYPNLYVILVGPPGVGKTVVTDLVGTLWRGVPDIHVAPTSITDAAIVDSLAESTRKVLGDMAAASFMDFNSLLISSNELSVFLPAYDGGMMSILTDVYDCKVFDQKRRGGKLRITIPRPQLNLIAGTTPSYLNELMPQGAWDQGFISRTIMIYSGTKVLKPLFAVGEEGGGLFQDIVHDLKIVAKRTGKMGFTVEAAEALQAWHMAGGAPAPEHPKLLHYNSRRTAHVIKLCMVACISRSNTEMAITLDDYKTAMNWLNEAEVYMPDVFRAMGGTGEGKVMEEAWHYIYSLYAKEKQPIQEHRIIHFLGQKVPSHSIIPVLTVMIKSNMIEIAGHDKVGRAFYKPSPKVTH